MNPATDPVSAAPPPQPHRLSTSCDRHPEERFTGFCPSCLCERLSVLDQTNNDTASSSSRKPPTISAAALKALFKPSGKNGGGGNGRVKPGFFPELRRTKSFSASKNNEGFSGAFEPQRRSCDVRLRSSLLNLFTQDETEAEPRKSSVQEPVLEANDEEEEAETEDDYVDFETLNDNSSDEVVEERDEIEEVKVTEKAVTEEEIKPMKECIDLDSSQTKKPSVRRSFWSAASVFSKKLQKWNQKLKKRRNGGGDDHHRPGSERLPVEKPIGRQLRDTQSEIADYRRSCDTDPRFSLDAAGRFSVDIGRISVDDPRYSFDEPRASWDGTLIGRKARPPPPPAMLGDMQIPVEEPPPPPVVNQVNNESDPVIVPGGSIQTRDYYNDSSSGRRKSLDRSSSIRKRPWRLWRMSRSREFETVGKWSILGLIYRKSVNKYEEGEEHGGMVERSLSESWPELRSGGEGGPRMERSNSNVSWRSTGGVPGRKVNGLERNKSSRCSSKNGENGMLDFYLAPMTGSRRMSVGAGGGGGGGGGWANSHGHSIARNVMRLYPTISAAALKALFKPSGKTEAVETAGKTRILPSSAARNHSRRQRTTRDSPARSSRSVDLATSDFVALS
ncbi:hypothetical protein Bca52824_085521 [Brassica carinata]|uniref:Uncharacterized protein n=1 Tax=Brassica carinata TaxID=52824 RepID=A0A8X7P8A7_BRACI|nr:hypothetical protein Bca52824_085521 [Brassica carinata]